MYIPLYFYTKLLINPLQCVYMGTHIDSTVSSVACDLFGTEHVRVPVLLYRYMPRGTHCNLMMSSFTFTLLINSCHFHFHKKRNGALLVLVKISLSLVWAALLYCSSLLVLLSNTAVVDARLRYFY